LQGAKRASEFVASSRLLFAALSGCIRDIQTSLRCRSCAAPTACEIGDFSSLGRHPPAFPNFCKRNHLP
jgi:hypothetical protein